MRLETSYGLITTLIKIHFAFIKVIGLNGVQFGL